jgi:predicted glutamine amidotransferase
MGFTAKNSSSFPQILGKDLDNFLELSLEHPDGWGYSHLDRGARVAEKYREAIPALQSSRLKEQLATKTDGSLLHFRWASKGLDVKEKNSHPFSYEDVTFIHNGSFAPFDVLEPYISEKYKSLFEGETDSERYFFYLLTEIDKHGFLDGIQKGLEFIKHNISHSSANMMMMNTEYFVTAVRYNQDRIPAAFSNDHDYYEIRYKIIAGDVIVASSGWDQSSWTLIPNDTLFIVKRADQSITTRSL